MVFVLLVKLSVVLCLPFVAIFPPFVSLFKPSICCCEEETKIIQGVSEAEVAQAEEMSTKASVSLG